MKLKSIQLKIGVWAGICLLVTSGVIVTYSVWTMSKVDRATHTDAIESATEQVAAVASDCSNRIKADLEVSFSTARTLAEALSGIKDTVDPMDLNRDQVNGMLKTILMRNPQILGIYTCWEPNTFDGLDSQYVDAPGHDATGRFIPYWNRNAQGQIACEPLIEYEVDGAGDYYLLPKRTKQECMIAPYVYPVQGQPTLITSVVVPIIANNTFYGIAGIDLSLEFLQKLADNTDDMFDGAATIAMISNDGTLTGVTGRPELVGKHMEEVYPDYGEYLKSIQAGQTLAQMANGRLETFAPIRPGRTATSWSISVNIPEDVVTAKADIRSKKVVADMWLLVGIGFVCVLVALALLWFVARSIARPIVTVTDMFRDISEGEGDLTVRLDAYTEDEIGRMAIYFNQFVEKLQGTMSEVATNTTALATTSEELSSSAEGMTTSIQEMNIQSTGAASSIDEFSQSLTNVASGAEEMSSTVSTVATAIEEMSASLSEVAKSAAAGSQMSADADSKARAAGTTMSALNDSSMGIGKVIDTINDIADQTNLLALNATIEAASAGDAGKGFAVVASEVKELAKQTANSTGEIGRFIGEMQSQTSDAVNATSAISTIIEELNSTVQTISSAVEEQSATTNEIAQSVGMASQAATDISSNILKASTGSTEVSQNIKSLSSESAKVKTGADRANSSSNDMAEMASRLRTLVGQFKTG
ncbi:MAG: methyl-accepting chemotaxis protein [bacterium]|nr:methyl-accepting chemotaxis protein [bacterium]